MKTIQQDSNAVMLRVLKYFTILIGALFILSLVGTVNSLFAQSPQDIEGKWMDEDKGGIIQIYEENGKYFGKLIGSTNAKDDKKIKEKDKEVLILRNFKKQGENSFCCGTVFQPKRKVEADATLELEDINTLKIQASYMGFTKTKTWLRL